jgi:hypothetical protein
MFLWKREFFLCGALPVPPQAQEGLTRKPCRGSVKTLTKKSFFSENAFSKRVYFNIARLTAEPEESTEQRGNLSFFSIFP